jgi:hypothetical protein
MARRKRDEEEFEGSYAKENPNEGNVVKMGGNIGPLKEDIVKARDKVLELKSKRSEINADLKAIRENLEAKGITKSAFDSALRHYEKDPEQREGYDQGYIIAREAMGLPVIGAQMDMFTE